MAPTTDEDMDSSWPPIESSSGSVWRSAQLSKQDRGSLDLAAAGGVPEGRPHSRRRWKLVVPAPAWVLWTCEVSTTRSRRGGVASRWHLWAGWRLGLGGALSHAVSRRAPLSSAPGLGLARQPRFGRRGLGSRTAKVVDESVERIATCRCLLAALGVRNTQQGTKGVESKMWQHRRQPPGACSPCGSLATASNIFLQSLDLSHQSLHLLLHLATLSREALGILLRSR